MTPSQISFVKVKLWFTKLVNQSTSEQQVQLKKLQQDGFLDTSQFEMLNNMLKADNENKPKLMNNYLQNKIKEIAKFINSK